MTLTELTLEQLEANPYPIYQELRLTQPVAYVPHLGEWLISTWDACVEVGALSGTSAIAGGHPFEVEFFGGDNILTTEGETHDSLRAGVDIPLRPKHVRQFIDETAREIVQTYVANLKPRGAADLVTELFEPISVRAIGTQLGIGDVDDATLLVWFKALSGGLSHHNIDDRAAEDHAAQVKREIDDFLRERVAHLQDSADGSLLSHMIHGGVPEGQAPRSYDEIIPSVRVIILGGFQEPGTAISNTFFGLLSNPEQYAELVTEPGRWSAQALNEGMRWISPIGTVERTALEDVEVQGVTIPAGALITLVMASANRDEQRFERPEQFDFHRSDGSSMVFGFGNHYCAGNFLAKALGVEVIQTVARELPGLRLRDGAQPVVSGHLFQGVKSLPVKWDV